MRNHLMAAVGLLTLVCGANTGRAEETVIRSETRPDVSVERREGVVEHREVTTGSVDCGSKTIHKEDGAGNSKTVHKEGC